MLTRPDVLALGAGGVLGEAWMMGVLAGIEDAAGIDLRRCDYFVGTSAGSMVAAHLVAGKAPRRPSSTRGGGEFATPAPPPSEIALRAAGAARRAGALALAAGSPVASLALGISAPGGALVRASVLRRLPRPAETLDGLRRHVDESGAQFDGRLRVVAVNRDSGRRVVFGAPGAPRATVGQAVEASCTVPWLFAPARIGGQEYVDGGVWSPTNLDVAPAGRDTQVLCLNPTAGLTGTMSPLGMMRSFARSAVSVEALVLRRRGARVQVVAPNLESSGAMGSDFMDRQPRRRVLAAGYRQGLALGDPDG